MIEDLEKNDNQEEQEQLTCPECGKGFQDMRGLTSHARHMHNTTKKELINLIDEGRDKGKSNNWKIISVIGTALLTLLTFGKSR